MPLPRLLRVLFTGLSFLVFSAFGALLAYLILPVATLGTRGRRRHLRAQYVLHRCDAVYMGFMRGLGLFRLRTPRFTDLPPVLREGRPAVIIANHPALLDILWLVYVLPRATFLAKAEWFDNPFISPILRRGGHIAAPRAMADTPAEGAAVLERMLDRLRDGYNVVIFPEGTRSPAGGLRAFQRGAFEAAMRAGVPLVCLRITVDPPMLLKGQPWYVVPDRTPTVTVNVLDVIEPRDFPASARAFRRQVRARYARALGLPATPARPDVVAAGAAPASAPTGPANDRPGTGGRPPAALAP